MIIAIHGKAGSGKDTVGKMIQQYEKSFEIRKFADKLKDIVCIILNCGREKLEDRAFKESKIDWLNLSVRELMQFIGTELFREQIHTDIWVKLLMNDYKEIGKYDYSKDDFVVSYPNWVITDLRFKNVYLYLKNNYKDVVFIKINRPGIKSLNHSSEFDLGGDDITWNYVIENDGTLEELSKKINKIVLELKN